MKKEKLNWIYKNGLMIMVLVLVSTNASAQTIDRTIEKVANIGENVLINVKESNYDLEYRTWDKGTLKVEYSVHIEAKDKSELNAFYQELEKRIEEQLGSVTSGSITISYPFRRIIINNGKTKIQFEGNTKTYQLTKFKTSIIVYAPKINALDLSGSFCKINVGNLEADATIRVSSANFEMGNCKKLKLKADFCKNMKVGKVKEADIKVSSGDITLGEIETNLILNAGFSNIEVLKIGGNANLKLSSSTFKTADIKELYLKGDFVRRFVVDNIQKAVIERFSSSELSANSINTVRIENSSFTTFRIAKANRLSIEKSSSCKYYITAASVVDAPQCSFTDFTIGHLKKRFVTRSSSGSINLDNVVAGFEKISIDGQFVNIDINVDEGSDYKIEADLEFPNFRYSDLQFSRKEKNMNSEFLIGWKGNNNANSIIKFDCKSCSIALK